MGSLWRGMRVVEWVRVLGSTLGGPAEDEDSSGSWDFFKRLGALCIGWG